MGCARDREIVHSLPGLLLLAHLFFGLLVFFAFVPPIFMYSPGKQDDCLLESAEGGPACVFGITGYRRRHYNHGPAPSFDTGSKQHAIAIFFRIECQTWPSVTPPSAALVPFPSSCPTYATTRGLLTAPREILGPSGFCARTSRLRVQPRQ